MENSNSEKKEIYTIQVDLPRDLYERRDNIIKNNGLKKAFFDVKAIEFYIIYQENLKNTENKDKMKEN